MALFQQKLLPLFDIIATLTMANSSKRIGYIDALRGLTMLLVVFSHIYLPNQTPLNQLFIHFRMPLFFFISGFISFRREQSWSGLDTTSRLRSKVRTMIFPALIIGVVYTLIANEVPLVEFFVRPAKLGYWFTFALFNMLVFYYIARFLHARRGRTSIETFSKRFYIFGLLGFILLSDLSALGNVVNILTLGKTFEYLQYFAFGALCNCNRASFERVLDDGRKMAIIVLGYFIISWWLIASDDYVASLNPDNEPLLDRLIPILNSLLTALVGYFGIMTVYGLFRRFGEFFSTNRVVGKPLQYVGRNTLDVYLIHYFVLINFTPLLRPFIVDTTNILTQLVVGLTTAAAIVAVSLLIAKIIRLSDHLAYYLLGARDISLKSSSSIEHKS